MDYLVFSDPSEPLKTSTCNPCDLLWPFWHFSFSFLQFWIRFCSKNVIPLATSCRQALQPSGYTVSFYFWLENLRTIFCIKLFGKYAYFTRAPSGSPMIGGKISSPASPVAAACLSSLLPTSLLFGARDFFMKLEVHKISDNILSDCCCFHLCIKCLNVSSVWMYQVFECSNPERMLWSDMLSLVCKIIRGFLSFFLSPPKAAGAADA